MVSLPSPNMLAISLLHYHNLRNALSKQTIPLLYMYNVCSSAVMHIHTWRPLQMRKSTCHIKSSMSEVQSNLVVCNGRKGTSHSRTCIHINCTLTVHILIITRCAFTPRGARRTAEPSYFITAHCIVTTQRDILQTAFIHIYTYIYRQVYPHDHNWVWGGGEGNCFLAS